MQETSLKTTWKQRLIVALVAAILLGSSVAAYVAIVLGSTPDYSKMSQAKLQSAYSKKLEEYEAYSAELSEKYFSDLAAYRSSVKAFNSSTANSSGVVFEDLKEGSGETISPDSIYSAYYIGWCSDETVFDSSFRIPTTSDGINEQTTADTKTIADATSLLAPITVEPNALIEGWYLGTDGMKIGGVRELTVPSTLAYGEADSVCGKANSPLKFIVYTLPHDEKVDTLTSELQTIYTALMNALYSSYSNSNSTSAPSSSASESSESSSVEE